MFSRVALCNFWSPQNPPYLNTAIKKLFKFTSAIYLYQVRVNRSFFFTLMMNIKFDAFMFNIPCLILISYKYSVFREYKVSVLRLVRKLGNNRIINIEGKYTRVFFQIGWLIKWNEFEWSSPQNGIKRNANSFIAHPSVEMPTFFFLDRAKIWF